MKRNLLFAATFLVAPCLMAATPVSPDKAAPTQQLELAKILHDGGIMMWPLAFLSICGVLLILIYMLTIRRNAVVSDRFMDLAEAYIHKKDYLNLIDFCYRRNECMARVTQKTLEFITKYPHASFDGAREVAEAEGSRQAGLLSSRITYLADIGSIAPMIGLLGTVLGMIKSFLQIGSADIQGVRQMELASGISEALITTAAGLFVGIPALAFYSLFRGRVQKYIAELEAAATHLIALLQSNEENPKNSTLPSTTHLISHDQDPLFSKDRRDLHGI